MFARVVINQEGVQGVLDYHLPEELRGLVLPGCLVTVPLGTRVVQGIVWELSAESSLPTTRPVQSLLDTRPVLTAAQLRLASLMAAKILAPLASCIALMLPPGLSQHADTAYTLRDAPPAASASPGQVLSEIQQRILKLLEQRGELRGRQLESALPRQNWKPAAQNLLRRGLVSARPLLPPPSVRPKYARTVQLALSPEEIETRLDAVGRGGAALERRQAVLRFLMREPWPVLVDWAYAASGGKASLADLQKLAEDGLVVLSESEIWRDPLAQIQVQPQQPPQLTPEQHSAWEQVRQGLRASAAGEETAPYLLYGVTGSGKTEIYLRAVEETLAHGRQAVILVPEIALTMQTVRRFMARFPGRVGLIHSRLSAGERYDTWRRARSGQLSVIVGPRSALFTPLPDLGLIVIDECHEDSYYQESAPAYHAVEAALEYARLAGAALLLGSATPDVEMVFRAGREGWHLLRLPLRILAHRSAVEEQMQRLGHPVQLNGIDLPLPSVQIVDMREELKAGNRSIFSRSLQSALQNALQMDQQAILYLNRRGTATYIFCRSCGHRLECPRCQIPLTYHSAAEGGGLVCHRCNYRRQLPAKCPQCASPQIRQFGTGTEKVESELHALYPQARILRLDWETTRQKGTHDLIVTHFANHQADFLVGTQMLAKGLDLPLVTVVGIILADPGLSLPDFRAAERVFQLLTQVAGRAGRSPLGGKVLLQTFQPDHYAIRSAAGHDFESFYQQELGLRREIGYPPFTRLVRLEIRHAQNAEAERSARELAAQLQDWLENSPYHALQMIGPVPCYFTRENGAYRWQIVLRGLDPAGALTAWQAQPGHSLQGWAIQVDPPSLL